jgi:steroid 5-alpha reductase family enzyme
MNFLFNAPEPINVVLAGNLAAACLNFLVSFGMNNSSMFDQYWAMAPVAIALYYAFNEQANWSVGGSRKILALAALVTWAVRLFSLWFLKDERENDSGGKLAYGKEHEDSRYKAFRQQFGIFYWPYSFLALHIFPALMLHWGTMPLYYVLSLKNPAPTTYLDYLAFAFTMAAIMLETTADDQLIKFLHRKKTDPTLTFCKDGVWAWSRHPNYFGEFSFWLGMYLFGLAAVGQQAAWTGLGATIIFGLFVGYSVPFMDNRMRRYPDWKEYESRTNGFLPFPALFQKI